MYVKEVSLNILPLHVPLVVHSIVKSIIIDVEMIVVGTKSDDTFMFAATQFVAESS